MAQYGQWWEAFAGGEFPDWGGGQLSPTEEDYEERTRAFWEQVVGPSFGATTGFGDYLEHIPTLDPAGLEIAESEFRMAIGDVYGPGSWDPFRWEQVSRYSPSEAQQQLEGEFFGVGEYLGGEIGTEYGTTMAKGEEAYTSGLGLTREGLSYGGLTGSQSLLSGTSGAVLRSGEGITQSEDIIAQAYEQAKTLGTEFTETGEQANISLKENLNDALSAYLDAIDDEKSRWHEDIMWQVNFIQGEDLEVFEGDAESFESWMEGWEEGLYYPGDPSTDEEYGWSQYDPEQWEACGVGELWFDNGDGTGQCQVVTEYTAEGLPCAEGLDECGVCGGDGIPPGDCDCYGNIEDTAGVCGGSQIEDLCGVMAGDNSTCSGCLNSQACNYDATATIDDGSCEFAAEGHDCEGQPHSCDLTGCPPGSGPGVVLEGWNCSPLGHCVWTDIGTHKEGMGDIYPGQPKPGDTSPTGGW